MCFGGYETKKNSGDEVRAMNGFCFQFDNPVMAGEYSGGPKSHLSCELNSKLPLLDGMGWRQLGAVCRVPRVVRSPSFPLGFPTFISHDSPSWRLTCAALIPFPCDSSELWLPTQHSQGQSHCSMTKVPEARSNGSRLGKAAGGLN